MTLNGLKFNHFIEILQQQYSHIIGEQNQHRPTDKIVADIVSYYEDIISSMPGNVYWLDKNCNAVGCNQNVLDMFGFKHINEYKGLPFEEMARIGKWSNEAVKAFKADTLEVIETGKPKLNIEEPPINHHDGRTIYFLTSRVPLFDQARNLIGVVGISIDITELKQTQAALHQAKEQAEAMSKMKSEFLANMSHDMKTPLSGIIGLSELLTYRLKAQENLEFSQTILASGRQLLNFFNNCLEVFKLESGDVTLVKESFTLKSVIDEIIELYQPAAKTKGIALHIDYDSAIPQYMIGSYTGIYRVLLNLVGNAVKFTHKGSIIISAKLNKEKINNKKTWIKLEVKDTGIGIPREKLNIIFDQFIRLIPSYKGTYEGSGIGLFVVQRYVDNMQGNIKVSSEEGRGSLFSLNLPFEVDSSQVQEIKPQKKINPLPFIFDKPVAGEKDVHILLVEDNLTAQLMASSLLLSMNYHVDLADFGEKALEMFEPGKYNLIFMDIGLPGIQGDAVAKLMRKMEQGTSHTVPIIALTAHSTDDINKTFLSAGINNVLSKPLSREQAKEIILGNGM